MIGSSSLLGYVSNLNVSVLRYLPGVLTLSAAPFINHCHMAPYGLYTETFVME
jgi:hypothetical protein